MMGRELKSYPCARFNCNQMIKKNRPRRRILLNHGVKSVRALIKDKCITRLAKQRSIIKNKKLNLLIKSCTNSRKSIGSAINRRVMIYPFIPVKFHTLSKKSRERIKLASQKKAIKPSILAKHNILINKNVLANQITYLIKSFIPDESSVLINNSASENQVTYSRSKKYFFIPVKYIATNRKSNIMEKKSILRIDRSTLVGACSFQKRIQGTQLPVFPIPARTTLWPYGKA